MAVYTTASHSWAVGETVTAANMNSQLRDFINGHGPWTSFSPAWTSTGTAPAIGNGSFTGSYFQVGKLVLYRFVLTMGSTTTYGTGNYQFGVPVAQGYSASTPIGDAIITHSGTRYIGLAVPQSTSAVNILTQPAAGASAIVGVTSPVTFASGDVISVTGAYESA